MRYFKAAEYYGLRGEFQRFQSETNYPRPLGREAAIFLVSLAYISYTTNVAMVAAANTIDVIA